MVSQHTHWTVDFHKDLTAREAAMTPTVELGDSGFDLEREFPTISTFHEVELALESRHAVP